jgi:short-subunit dehydrogenase
MTEFYTLITGSSSGIGRALAIECAKKGMNILMVALPGTKLERLSEHIKKTYNVKSDYYFIDLTKENAPKKVYEWTRKNNYNINILINNAGSSCEGPFEKFSASFYYNLMQLNIVSLVLLSRLFLQELSKHQKSYILNLGSIASYFPMPYKAVYGSSKLFVYAFSRALEEELKATSVQVSIVCPGPVITNIHTVQSAKDKGKIARLLHIKPGYVAEYTIKKMLKGKIIIKTGFLSKVVYYAEKFIPQSIKQKIVTKIFYNE